MPGAHHILRWSGLYEDKSFAKLYEARGQANLQHLSFAMLGLAKWRHWIVAVWTGRRGSDALPGSALKIEIAV